jgi:hypothetical protein
MNIVKCPHCDEYIIIEKLNCKIFRHGVYIDSGKQINPHMNKQKCDKLFSDNKIYGCGKPFKIVIENDIYKTIICDYI